MALPRPYWKGYLKLSLVSCPIAIYASTSSSERIAFKQVSRTTGNRLRQQLVDEETGDLVESADKARGFEVGKGDYLLIEDDELDAVAIESSHTIDIDSFVPEDQIDPRYLDAPYYLVPNDKVGQDAFAVIRDAMRGKGMVAIGRVVLAKRERIMMLRAWDKGLLGTTLRYASEVRDTTAYFGDLPDIQVAPDMLKLAEHILDSKRADFDPTLFRDRYEDALVTMIKAKQAGTRTTATQPEVRDQEGRRSHGGAQGESGQGRREASGQDQRQEAEGRDGDGQEARRGSARHAAADRGHEGCCEEGVGTVKRAKERGPESELSQLGSRCVTS